MKNIIEGCNNPKVIYLKVTAQLCGRITINGDKLTFKWAFKSRPKDSTVRLNDYTSVKPTFTADVPGTYVLNLIVNDGTADSDPATCTIKIETSGNSISQ